MDLVQSSLQASFNARIERLAEQEAAELRTIFRFFDTDVDGVVSADQACRIFGLVLVIDSYRRGLVTKHELFQFLRSSFSPFPQHDMDRFLELHDGSLALTKDAFMKFRRACTLRDLAPPDPESSSDDEHEDDHELDKVSLPQQADPTSPDDKQETSAQNAEDRPARRRKMSSASQISRHEQDAAGDAFNIDSDVLHDEYVDEDDPSDDGASIASSAIGATSLPHADLMTLDQATD
ncbi:hypothetical protein P43SY_005431 [Pythium insidiosum]|uniref:EF-hand domain-containing protein n=1 Tax=Pythium insidiosum TaxID=114742 RepID=A0AAD5Q2E1_PYTIN|nr:hypothetical protein P43SY_005431 [Pythium insidiosum]